MARGESGRPSVPLGGSPEFMTTAQVARWLGASPRTVSYWAAAGTLPAVKIGRQWRFEKSAVRKWIDSKRSGPRQRNSNRSR